MKINKKDLYWLAGLLEGEAWFIKGSPSRPNQPKIGIKMSDKDVMDRVGKLFENKVSVIIPAGFQDKRGIITRKTIYQVIICGSRAIILMKLLYPLMSKRRQHQIKIALDSYKGDLRIRSGRWKKESYNKLIKRMRKTSPGNN